MRNRGMRERNKGVVVWLAMFFCMALISALSVTSYADTQFYETFFCKVYYDDEGSVTDDNLAYWYSKTITRTTWPNQITFADWSFLYALWGLGWNRIWTTPGGIAQTIATEGKLPVYLVDEGQTGTYGYNYIGEWGIYLNYAYYTSIMDPSQVTPANDPDGDGFPNPGLYADYYTALYDPLYNIGSVGSHETSHAMYGQYVGDWYTGEANNQYYYHGFLTEAIAWYTGSVMWPYSDFHEDLSSIRSQYRENMEAGGYLYTSWGRAEYNYRFATTYDEFYRGTMTFLGAGYLFLNWDDLGFGTKNPTYYFANWSHWQERSIYRVYFLLSYLRNDPIGGDFSMAFASAYDGHQAKMSALTYWNLDPDSNDLNAWLFYLMWDYWYQA